MSLDKDMLNELFKLSLQRNMLGVLGSGLLYGIGISFMLGTVFFALLFHGQKLGWKAGVFIASGVILSDLLFIGLALFLGTQTKEFMDLHQTWVFTLGGVLLILLGIGQWKARKSNAKHQEQKLWKLLPLGFTLNIANPVNFLVWFALAAMLSTKGYAKNQQIIFMASSLGGIFMAEVFIAILARGVLKNLKDKVMSVFQKVVGLIFCLAGLWLLYQGLQ